jgi:hypothetical protein
VSEEPRPRSTAAVAYEALNLGKANQKAIESHEDVCAERYSNINTAIDEVKNELRRSVDGVKADVTASVGEIKTILGWAGGLGLSVIITMLGYLALSQWEANQDAQKAATEKIALLERQVAQQQASAPQP